MKNSLMALPPPALLLSLSMILMIIPFTRPLFLYPYPSKSFKKLHHHRERHHKPVTTNSICFMTAESTSIETSSPPKQQHQQKMQFVDGIHEIINDYDIFLLDMWGVLHDGYNTYDGVIDCIEQLHEANKKLIILSNSSQQTNKSIHNLKKLGFTNPQQDFVQIITSGEVAHTMLSSPLSQSLFDGACQNWNVLTEIQVKNQKQGKDNKVFVLGTETKRDVPFVESTGWKFATSIEEADLILACGTFAIYTVDGKTKTETNKRNDPEAYEKVLRETFQKAAKRQLPMMISNPDKVRPDFERPPMPGTYGDMYEQALIDNGIDKSEIERLIKRIGKPFHEVYDIALKDTPDHSRACMVGDAIETDIVGGSLAGIDTIWVLKDGIYKPELQKAAKAGKTLMEAATAIRDDFNENKERTYAKGQNDQSPTITIPHFRW